MLVDSCVIVFRASVASAVKTVRVASIGLDNDDLHTVISDRTHWTMDRAGPGEQRLVSGQ